MARSRVPRGEEAAGFRVGPFDDPDRYEIGLPVEAGAEGILYRGHLLTPTTGLSLDVAVKALQPAYAGQVDQWAARWRDQVELLRSLQIPGLVAVREGFVGAQPHRPGAPNPAGRNLYLVMNWVEGEPLERWIAAHPGLDHLEVLKRLLPVAVALDTMHNGQLTGGVPVVHRDVKPANLLLGDAAAVLVDFGLTRGLSSQPRPGKVGTPGYIAPEVLAGHDFTPAADRYAFGATTFFVLTGSHITAGMESDEIAQELDGFPAELVARVLAMLSPDPAARPAALANWVAQLRQSSLGDDLGPAVAQPVLLSGEATVHRPGLPLGEPAITPPELLPGEPVVAPSELVPGERPGPAGAPGVVARTGPRRLRRRSAVLILSLMLAVAAAALISSRGSRVELSAGTTSTNPSAPATRPEAGPTSSLGRPVASDQVEGTAPPATGPRTEPTPHVAPTTTLRPCRLNSRDPACGPFRWSVEPRNEPLQIIVGVSPRSPVANQPVTFRIVIADADQDEDLRVTESSFGDTPMGGQLPRTDGCDGAPTGTWQLPPAGPPGRTEREITHTYTEPGTYDVRFAAASGRRPDPCEPPDPYASWASSPPMRVVIGSEPVGGVPVNGSGG